MFQATTESVKIKTPRSDFQSTRGAKYLKIKKVGLIMNASAPIFQAFDYSQFPNQDLIVKAQNTFGNLVGFVRQAFDGLIEIGSALSNFQDECLNTNKNGKKVFSKWLDSFGALRYVAKSAMDMYNWFKDLDPRIQQLIRENVQNWKISALRELRHLTIDVLKEVVTSGNKSVKQIKQLSARDSKNSVQNTNGTEPYQGDDSNGTELVEFIESNSNVELVPGMRVVVRTNDAWNGSTGKITTIHKEDQFWVLLDHIADQGYATLNLYKRSQLEPEVKIVVAPAPSKKMYTEEELQARIQETLATKELEEAELQQAKYKEMYDSAKNAVRRDMAALERHADNLAKQKEQLTAQLQQALEEIQRLQGLHVKNQQLEQRVNDLEKALLCANRNSWNNTLNKQAAKVINKEVEKALPLLISEVERLQGVVSAQEQEIIRWRQSYEPNAEAKEIEKIVQEFGEIAENLGWNGWNRHGYRAVDGTLYKDISAITYFVSDLKLRQQAAFQN